MWRSVDIVLTDVSDELIAFIFREEKNKKFQERGTGASKCSQSNVESNCIRAGRNVG
jgi:hypothetical protein